MDEARIERLEARVAELLRQGEELSEVVARQGGQIDRLERRIALLLAREAEREEAGGAVALGDERPPHW